MDQASHGAETGRGRDAIGRPKVTDGPATARVEVLTAEVRTLVVGSRQVTMSVYSQLDRVSPDQIRAFGRVRPGRAFEPSWLYLIGADAAGNLVRSSLREGRSVAELRGLAARRRELLKKESPEGEAFEAIARMKEEFEALPLIVLAGLR